MSIPFPPPHGTSVGIKTLTVPLPWEMMVVMLMAGFFTQCRRGGNLFLYTLRLCASARKMTASPLVFCPTQKSETCHASLVKRTPKPTPVALLRADGSASRPYQTENEFARKKYHVNGARGGTRTLTRFNPAPDFKSGVSAISPLWRGEDG